MKTIIFTAYDSTGFVIDTIYIDGIIMYGTDYYDEKINQKLLKTADNGTVVVGNSMEAVHGILALTAVSDTHGKAFRLWMRASLEYQVNYVGIDIAGVTIDLGNGAGVSIGFSDRARYISNKGNKLSSIEAPLIHKIRFEYIFKR